MIKTLNLNRQTTAVLENASNVGYEKPVNGIWTASFSLPINDTKVSKVEMLGYVEIADDLYRVMPKETNKSANKVTFQCEHVLSTLFDACLFRYHQLSNYKTREVIGYLLDQQETKHWELRRCDFERRFHYSWENENGLVNALFSVPRPFNEPFMWQFDTSTYPWQIDLIRPDTVPTCRIKEGHNLVDFVLEEDPKNMINRIYPLGAGEGVNQLTIESVNGGKVYLEDRDPGEEIIKYVWVDRRYTDAESLKADAQAKLNEWKRPKMTWIANAADVSSITGLSIDKLVSGAVVRLQVGGYPATDLRIMKESKKDLFGAPGDVDLEIGNVVEDLGATNSDMERRQQINELYSQGSTNMLHTDKTENADPEHPVEFKVWIPEDAININYMELTWETNYFRGYTKGSKAGGHFAKAEVVQSKSTADGGAFVKEQVVQSKSTEDGGAYVKASVVQSKSTANGGGQTSSAGGDHRHLVFKHNPNISGPPGNNRYESQAGIVEFNGSPLDLYTYGSSGDHTHKVSDHTHIFEITIPAINIPKHKHNFTITIPQIVIPKHAHEFNVTIPAINIPDHEHEQIYGIYEHDKMPSKLEIKVDGNKIEESSLSGETVDLVPYLEKDDNDKIKRGRFAIVEIRPIGEIAQISANIIWGLFIQSQKGGKF